MRTRVQAMHDGINYNGHSQLFKLCPVFATTQSHLGMLMSHINWNKNYIIIVTLPFQQIRLCTLHLVSIRDSVTFAVEFLHHCDRCEFPLKACFSAARVFMWLFLWTLNDLSRYRKAIMFKATALTLSRCGTRCKWNTPFVVWTDSCFCSLYRMLQLWTTHGI